LIGLGTLVALPLLLAHAVAPLPGQQIWQHGVSSWLFGTNDASWDWSASNPGTNAAIAATVKGAGITLIRTPLHANDADARVAVVEASGVQCLGILQPEDAEAVVKTMGSRCNLYEWMNEPDNGGPSASAYAASWNQEIPRLRALNPNALFLGPVVASPNTDYIKQFLAAVTSTHNLPDIVSYHMYPCTDQSISNCPKHIGDYGREAQGVNDAVQSVLGHTLPLAVTEWNYSWKPGQTPQNDPYMGTFTQQSIEAMAQAGMVMANQFDLASNAGGGVLDLVHPQTGKSTPQLDAMKTMIKAYRTGVNLPTTTSVTPTLGTGTPTSAGTPGIVSNGTLLSAQQLVCPMSSSSSLVAPSSTANACTFLTQITTSDQPQQVALTWWSEGITVPSNVQIALSGDSTDGHNGTWTTWPSSLATGGMQLLSVPGHTYWISVQLSVSPATTGPVMGVIELYALSSSMIPMTPTPTGHLLPAAANTPIASPTPTRTPTSISTPPVVITRHD
jgi:hypothetical protein